MIFLFFPAKVHAISNGTVDLNGHASCSYRLSLPRYTDIACLDASLMLDVEQNVVSYRGISAVVNLLLKGSERFIQHRAEFYLNVDFSFVFYLVFKPAAKIISAL